mmetsp:Transcript_825/g.1308  ORF Transcript_825/g.1308 Transcript_825/m.1308 type:complete len:393 (+) Transcript_825:119-1297(+)
MRSASATPAVLVILQTINGVKSSFVALSHRGSHEANVPVPSRLTMAASSVSRRDMLLATIGSTAAVISSPSASHAVVTDQTSNWANTDRGSSYSNIPDTRAVTVPPALSEPITNKSLPSDEFTISFDKSDIRSGQSLGIELQEVKFRTNMRVQVKNVQEGSIADLLGVSKLLVVVAVNGESTERTDAKGVQIMVQRVVTAIRNGKDEDLELTFRDPSIFLDQLRKGLKEGEVVTTQVAPAGDTTQRTQSGRAKGAETSQEDQRFSVTQLKAPIMCNRGAGTDDLLEISYVGSVVETGTIFDGSAITIDGKGIPGRGNDVSLFFVLGKQPFGQFPPGWDVGLEGMCVGERRRVVIPPVLAYGSVGVPRRNIPPDATLQYDITLISINGLALPQ